MCLLQEPVVIKQKGRKVHWARRQAGPWRPPRLASMSLANPCHHSGPRLRGCGGLPGVPPRASRLRLWLRLPPRLLPWPASRRPRIPPGQRGALLARTLGHQAIGLMQRFNSEEWNILTWWEVRQPGNSRTGCFWARATSALQGTAGNVETFRVVTGRRRQRASSAGKAAGSRAQPCRGRETASWSLSLLSSGSLLFPATSIPT